MASQVTSSSIRPSQSLADEVESKEKCSLALFVKAANEQIREAFKGTLVLVDIDSETTKDHKAALVELFPDLKDRIEVKDIDLTRGFLAEARKAFEARDKTKPFIDFVKQLVELAKKLAEQPILELEKDKADLVLSSLVMSELAPPVFKEVVAKKLDNAARLDDGVAKQLHLIDCIWKKAHVKDLLSWGKRIYVADDYPLPRQQDPQYIINLRKDQRSARDAAFAFLDQAATLESQYSWKWLQHPQAPIRDVRAAVYLSKNS